ncbi:MAG TPA: M18 family aminopeptidase [Euzebya sp.]|nr:M18 family aminopeptidase [Euzebya sp.]
MNPPDTDAGASRLLGAYIEASPSPFHAAESAAQRLRAAGFLQTQPSDPLPASGDCGLIISGGALIAWRDPLDRPASAGFRVIGAHTDSPNLRIKPRPDRGVAGYRQLGIEVYGGALQNSWLDRDLGLSGRVAVRAAGAPTGTELRLMRVDRPLLRVAQLAIHLDRDVNSGLSLNAQTQLTPIWGLGPPRSGDFAAFVAAEIGTTADEIVWWDLMAHDLTPPALLGHREELLAAPRIDNLASCWAAVEAIATAGDDGAPAQGQVVALFDHEEVGSMSTTGAVGPLLEAVIERLVLRRGGGRDDHLRAKAASTMVSADGAHAAHPNYLDRYDPEHLLVPNGGPAIKVNQNQRYATSAQSVVAFVDACHAAGVPFQTYSHRSNLPCGSTIGPLSAANLGIDTVDVGIPQLSMHSARELCGADDPGHLLAALSAYLAG